jgi:hypothetical protein
MNKFLWAAAGLALLVSCEMLNGPDLKAKAQAEVTEARASVRHLTITTDSAGTTVPSGALTLKDGFSVDIEGTAQPETVLVGWKQSGGTGHVDFTPVSSTKMNVKVSGGDATVTPVYEVRPVVLYMTPIGNNIAKNSSVRLVFNREVDLGSAITSPLVSIRKQGTVDVPYTIVTKAGSSSVTFKPQAPSLDDYAQYVVGVKPGVVAKLVFDSAHYPGVTFLNTTVTTRTEYNNPFQTGASFDTLPPYVASPNPGFLITSSQGNTFYGTDDQVMLASIDVIDDSGDGGVATFSIRNEADPYPDFPYDYTYDMSKSWLLKANADGKYRVSMIFKDVNGNAMAPTSEIWHTFLIDKTPPTIGGFAVASGAFAGYIATTSSTFTLTASDPVISGTSIPGSGESADGSTLVDQKKYRLSNDGVTWSAWAALPGASSPWTLAAGADGLRTVTAQVEDGVGNTSSATSSLVLDTTPPAVSAVLSTGGLLTTSTAVSLLISASDSGSGLNQINLGSGSLGVATGSTYTSSLNAVAGGSGTISGSHTLASSIAFADTLNLVLDGTADGTKHIDLLVTDKLGNTTTKSIDAVLDRAVPTVTSVNFASLTTSTNSVSVNVSASDATTGVASIGWQIIATTPAAAAPSVPATSASATWIPYSPTFSATFNPGASSEREYLYVWFRDAAGNITAPNQPGNQAYTAYSNVAPTATFTLNTTSPSKSSTVSLNWSAAAYNSTNIASIQLSNDGVTWVNQSGSGTATATVSGASWNITSGGGGTSVNGTKTVYLKITDTNTPALTTTKTVSLVYDNQLPIVSGLTVSGTGGSGFTNSLALNVSFGMSDNLTPTNAIKYRISANGANWTTLATTPKSSVSTTYNLVAPVNGLITIAVELTDQAGNVSSPLATTTIVYDTVVPTISSPLMNSGATYTASNLVTLSMNYTDPGTAPVSGVAWMRFSNDGTNWLPWTASSTTFSSWDLTNATYGGTTANGTRTVYYQVMDAAGNQSTVLSDSIQFDNTAPSATAPTSSATSSSRYVTLTNTATDNWSGISKMQSWSDGHLSGWINYAATIGVLLTPQNGAKNIYMQYMDNAGNVSSWVYLPITLTETWSNMAGRAEMVGSNYTSPGSNNHAAYATGTPPTNPPEDTTYLTYNSSTPLVLGTGTTGPRSFVFVSNTGQVGKFDYYFSGVSPNQTLTFYYQTLNNFDNSINGSWTVGTMILGSGGGWQCLDVDNATWNGGNTLSGAVDFYIQNKAGTFTLYPYGSFKAGLF